MKALTHLRSLRGRQLRRAVRRFLRQALILTYHRVGELPTDPQLLSVSEEHFCDHLEIMRAYAHPMRLEAIAQALQGRRGMPRRGVAVTFDDGYTDNLYNARPLLARFDIPATVFVAGECVGSEREFWWDELDRLLLYPGSLPETLSLSISGHVHRWELGESAHYDKAAFARYCTWNVLDNEDPTPRQHLYRSLYKLIRPLPRIERQRVLDELRARSGIGSRGRLTHRTLSSDELVNLAEEELVEIGAHTMSHPILSTLPIAAQKAEILVSKARLEAILGRPVTGFSYPYGNRSAYTTETTAAIRDAGFAYACANFAGAVWHHTDRFQLPRVVVRDWDGEEFARRLKERFRG